MPSIRRPLVTASADTRPRTENSAVDVPAVEFSGIWKYFASSDVQASADVSFAVAAGSVHAVIGENGAGKSTLMNILYGIHQPDRGEILLRGQPTELPSPREAIAAGIGMVHQHFRLVPSFTAAENIVLGTEPTRRLDRRRELEEVTAFCAGIGLDIDAGAAVETLAVGVQQRVEIAKLLWRNAEILILDEPTAVLTPSEVDDLFEIIARLAGDGRTILFITHKLREVEAVTDRVTVMRAGRVITTEQTSALTQADLAELMVGREVELAADRVRLDTNAAPADEAPACRVTGLRVTDERNVDVVKDASLSIGAGEIVGLAGVSGNGQTPLVEAIAGLRAPRAGSITLADHDVTSASSARRRALGLGHIPEDRLEAGVSVDDTIRDNLLPGIQRGFDRFMLLRNRHTLQATTDLIAKYRIAGAHPLGPVRTLSGGNMQKVVIARELEQNPRFLIADQPTRGVDVGSVEYIHDLLRAAARSGVGILLVSAELDEILALSDRIAVMFDGRIVADDIAPGHHAVDRIGPLMGGAE